MSIKNTGVHSGVAGIVVSALLASSVAFADTSRDVAPGYVTGSDGGIARSSSGECVRTSAWEPKNAVIVGCDNVILKAPTTTKKGGSTGLNTAIVIPAATMFKFDSDVLTASGKKSIETYRAKIKPELTHAYAAVIVGHTDSTGDAKYNVELSKRRAASVRDYLIETGTSPAILRVVGRGANEPIVSNNTETGKATNRRVEIIVFGEARALDVMRFPSVALFTPWSSKLTIRGKKVLAKNQLEGREQLTRAVYIEVIGHTDDVGDKQKNQELSEARAQTVRDSLVQAGVDPSRIMTVGAGGSQPLASNQTEEGREQNRRVEVMVLGRVK